MSFFTHHTSPTHTLPVYESASFRVVFGANEGDHLGIADDLVLDDGYKLLKDAKPAALALQIGLNRQLTVARASHAGTAGNVIHLDCVLTLMNHSGATIEALVLVEVGADGRAEATYLLPLAPIAPGVRYRLVGIDRDTATQRFAQMACASFARGTCITLADGRQMPVEKLSVGDAVLTRNDGVQKIRWIGQMTQRAIGEFAPVRIAAGALNNHKDLVVSPEHRLFIHQRSDQIGAGRSELLIKARHLVNDRTVTVETGGFVDYYQILFDRHQIVFAEGIAAESLLVDARTAALLPDAVARKFIHADATQEAALLSGFDLPASLLKRSDATERLREASAG